MIEKFRPVGYPEGYPLKEIRQIVEFVQALRCHTLHRTATALGVVQITGNIAFIEKENSWHQLLHFFEYPTKGILCLAHPPHILHFIFSVKSRMAADLSSRSAARKSPMPICNALLSRSVSSR
jgi:hypothetical protein